jgi:methylenetetrahydrofolate reductase (NADPH)
MSPTSSPATASPPSSTGGVTEAQRIAALVREASVEMTWHDVDQLDQCRKLLSPGTRVYVSHIPGLSWAQSVATCVAVRAAGLEPVPHVPVRELGDAADLRDLLAELIAQAGVQKLLLIAGDRSAPLGAFAQTTDVLSSGVLEESGIRTITVAGHPEGHPRISAAELRRAEVDKLTRAREAGLELSFLTQFFFEPEPFLTWVQGLRARGVRSRIIAGLAGPARLATLFKYAIRCGVGRSIRALGARPASFAHLVGERGPESVVRAIASAASEETFAPTGLHFYSFGGLARTCAWIEAVAHGRFALDGAGFVLSR